MTLRPAYALTSDVPGKRLALRIAESSRAILSPECQNLPKALGVMLKIRDEMEMKVDGFGDG